MRLRFFVGLVFVVSLGCNSKPYDVGPVSGKVTLDGKPLSKASITFVPMATKGNNSPGPTAAAMTDADGKYSLMVNKDTPGSVVGKCRIYITTLFSDPALDDRDGGPAIKRPADKVPAKYNLKTDLTFDVPAGGTDKADFDLKTK